MKLIIIFTLSLICAIAAASTIAGDDQEWTQFKIKFGKKYSDAEEETHRRSIFINNKQLIESHNKLHDEGESSFRMGLNQFADLSEEEFVGMLKPIPEARTPNRAKLFKGSVNAVPDSIDWRDYNLVTEVKDDRTKCGSVTAYATTGAIEGQHAAATGNLISLSEDNLSYCTFPIGDGCSGGLLAPSDLYNYVIDFDGQDAENCCLAYDNGMCYNDTSCKAATILSYNSVPSTDEDALKQACGTFGPIAAGIDGSHITFQLYSSGIYNDPLCSPTQLNHALLVVGYGTEITQDYWLAKNSWGTSWGMEGYIELSRNNDNQCGIATNANWPTV